MQEKPKNFGEWLEKQFGPHNRGALEDSRNQLANGKWNSEGRQNGTFDTDRETVEQVMFDAYINGDQTAVEKIANWWRNLTSG